ncbi:MAG: hypothetical protein P8N93_02515 [Flavobacteriaceae bacterium]|nr:hypothetical protein [Flavobacteriaceae bacterium]
MTNNFIKKLNSVLVAKKHLLTSCFVNDGLLFFDYHGNLHVN